MRELWIMIEIQHLTKTFPTADGNFDALHDVSLKIEDGEIYGIIGMSGAGKSTLVRCINMLERPTEGKVIIDGRDMSTLTEYQLREQRRNITMIFQGFNLLMQRNSLRNVCFPLELAGVKKSEAVTSATTQLARDRRSRRQAQELPVSALGRPAAARGYCPRAGDPPEDIALRRGNERA